MNHFFAPAIRFMNRLKYPRKILFLGSIVLSIIFILSIALYQQLNQIIVTTKIELEGVEKIVENNDLIRLAQQFRGLSAIKMKNDVQFNRMYEKKQQQTDRAFYNFIDSIESNSALKIKFHNSGIGHINEYNPLNVCKLCNMADLNTLSDLRILWEKIKNNRSNRSTKDDFVEHSYLISQLQLVMSSIGDNYRLITDRDLSSFYLIDVLTHNIPDTTESMGRIRAKVLGVLSDKQLTVEKSQEVMTLITLLERSVHKFNRNLKKIAYYSPTLKEQVNLVSLQLITEKNKVVKRLNNEIYSGNLNMIPRQFWADITKNIDGLYSLMHQYIVPALTIHLNNRIEQASITLNTVIIIAIFLFLLSLYFMIALYKALLSNIVHISETINYFSQGKLDSRIKLSTDDEMRDISIAINDMANKLEKSQKLVAFQQKVLDEHAIVSITDVKGNITYCNDKFEKISQYSKNELIGQNHRILKTDEHPDSVFKEMWKTIANGKIWHGEVKNKAKDGSFYWVSATIAPYLNEQGKPQQYLSIRTDISHIKKLETKQIEVNKLLLAEKLLTEHEKQKAEKANQAKSEFLSSMSHELRTPLNAILGFAQVLKYDDTLDNEQQDSVDEIIKGGNHLLELINQVLDLAKIESGHIKLIVESVKLTDVLNECYSLMNPVASQYKICINYIDIGDYYVQADKTRLKQILLNLLNNAIKYNHPDGNVELRVSRSNNNNNLKITVSDTGYGIAEKYLDNLFQPFNRLDAENSGIEGTGIGLAICLNLIEIMSGRIGVKSELNKGSCFWIELPMDKIH